MQEDKRYACLLIDRHKPGVYSTLHLLDQRWWDWLHQPSPDALRRQSSVEIPLPAGCVTEDGEETCAGTSGSFRNDLMQAAVSALDDTWQVQLSGLDAWVEEDAVRAAAYAACAERGIDPSRVVEGLWY